jgi:precorrin-6B methylase 2
MSAFRAVRQTILTLTVSLAAASVFAQATATQNKPFEPQVGQPGKDVVWVPTPQALVDKMLDMAKLTAQDIHYDLGSGDGRTVITAAKRGATSFGIEYNPDMVALSQKNAAAAGVTDKATFTKADLFETDFSKANVLTLFLLPDINLKLRPKILDMRPGTRVVSNSFTMGEWEADETAQVTEGCTSWCTALMWIVPAKVNGTWKTPQGEMTINQTFQMFTGTVRGSGGAQPISGGRLRGEEIRFTVNGQEYTGRVSGNTMSGTIAGGGKWTATR